MTRLAATRDPPGSGRAGPTASRCRDYGEVLANHLLPVTVINGEFDYVVGPRGSPLWIRLTETVAPDVQVTVIPDAAHSVWIDQPDAFREALRRALME